MNFFDLTTYLNGSAQPFESRVPVDIFGTQTSGVSGTRTVDLDQGGDFDLISFDDGGGGALTQRVGIRLASNGSFGPASTMTIGITPLKKVVADVDNDQRQDLVLLGTGPAAGAVRTLINSGTGSLIPAATLILPRQAEFLAVADVDGDGLRDAVVGSIGPLPDQSSDIRYYPGLGTGEFGAGVLVWSGNNLSGLTVGDVDGDSMMDVVVASFSFTVGQQLETLVGTGTGSFTSSGIAASPDFPRETLFLKDFNGDGKRDLFGTNVAEAIVMLGNGDGSFGQPLISSSFHHSTFATFDAAFADFDGDGNSMWRSTERVSRVCSWGVAMERSNQRSSSILDRRSRRRSTQATSMATDASTSWSTSPATVPACSTVVVVSVDPAAGRSLDRAWWCHRAAAPRDRRACRAARAASSG